MGNVNAVLTLFWWFFINVFIYVFKYYLEWKNYTFNTSFVNQSQIPGSFGLEPKCPILVSNANSSYEIQSQEVSESVLEPKVRHYMF